MNPLPCLHPKLSYYIKFHQPLCTVIYIYIYILIVPVSIIDFVQLTGTVSHVLGKATFDSSFQEEREQIVESAQSGGGYFMAGLMGFTGGVFSGITSMVTQPYKGAQESGIGVRDW